MRTMWSPDRQAGPTKAVGPAFTVKYEKKDGMTLALPLGQGLSSIEAPRHYVSCEFHFEEQLYLQ